MSGADEVLPVRNFWQSLKAYVADDDPLVASSNLVALVVAWNQPFYPLYVWWSVSDVIWPSYFTFLSTPFFLAVPWLSRRHSFAGRALLPIAGIANTMQCINLFGIASGVEAFLIPCLLIAFVFFRPSERWFGFAVSAFVFVLFVFFRDWTGAPVHVYSDTEQASFLILNAASAGTLTMFLGLLIMGLINQTGKGR